MARSEVTGQKVSEDSSSAPGPRLFLTEAQLAERWGLSPYSVYEMRRRGVGPRFHVFSRAAVRYSLDEIEAYERCETFQTMGEVYAARSGRARARAQHRKQLQRARQVRAETIGGGSGPL